MKTKPLSDMDGFTPAQRFFLAWGRVWASNVAPQFVAYIVNSDVHSPSISRVNAALPMIDNWYKAFDIKEGDKLFGATTESCSYLVREYFDNVHII